MNRTVVLSMVLSLTAFLPGRGEDTPKNRYYGKPYDAVSEMVTPDGRRVTTRVQCDGNGKVRNEMTSRSGTSYTIMDCNTKQVSTVIEQSKMIMKSKAPDQALSSEEQREKTDVKQLGTQTIDGHPCKGESYTSKGAKYEIWRAIDIDYPIKTVCETSRGKSEMKLKSFSSTPPPKSAFQLPTGYKEVNPAALTTPR